MLRRVKLTRWHINLSTLYGEMIKRAMSLWDRVAPATAFPCAQGINGAWSWRQITRQERVPVHASWIHCQCQGLTPDLSCLVCLRDWSSCLPGIVDVAVAQPTQILIATSRIHGSCAKSYRSWSTRHVHKAEAWQNQWWGCLITVGADFYFQPGISERGSWWISA